MRVIFLDIDGVMNSNVFYRERHKRRFRKPINWWYELRYLFKKVFKIQSKGVSLADYKTPDSFYTFESQFERLQEETCPIKWKWLTEWCNENDIKICVSSVWKHHFGNIVNEKYVSKPELWEKAFVELGFKPNTYVGITGDRKSLRGEEIQEWLDKHPEVEDYAILDDDSDMMDHQFDKFHHCDSYFGMSPNHLYRINRQFKKQNINYYGRLNRTIRKYGV
jgi:hypothetical protein